MRLLPALALLLLCTACPNPAVIGTGNGDGGGTSDGGDATGDGGSNGDAGEGTDGGDGGIDTSCIPADLLILLDRTGTMHRDLLGNTPPDTPAGHQSSKHYQAITAVKALVSKPGVDHTVDFGLALFPKDPGGSEACLTLTQRLQGQAFANPACQEGQVIVPPALDMGATIASAIDPETTTICFSTPTGAGLLTALQQLQSNARPNAKQYVMLVTDGADFYASCPDPDPMVVLQQMHAQGVDTFIVGFGGQDVTPSGVNPPMLNRMACAGHTAKDFDTNCQQLPDGGYDAVNPDGGMLYFDAANSAELDAALKSVALKVCCGCIL